MCGRYSLGQDKENVRQRFRSSGDFEFFPRYNVVPGQNMPVLTSDAPTKISFLKWGLIPNYSLDAKSSQNFFNLKSENLLSRSPFRQTVRSQRCLVIADGYYEWKKEGKQFFPYRFTLPNDKIFAMAGVWDYWENPKNGEVIYSFSTLTKSASDRAKEVSDRMPVILSQAMENHWLQARLSDNDLIQIMEQSENSLSCYKCHRAVNSIETDSPLCIEPAPRLYPGDTYSLFDK